MRKNYNIPLNDTSQMEIGCSPQSNYMPSFLIGNTNNNSFQNDSFFVNQPKNPQSSFQTFSPFDTKQSRTTNELKRHESFHNGSRKNGPPINSLKNMSPKSPFIKSVALCDESSFSNSLNSSRHVNKPYAYESSSNSRNHNVSIKESDAYSRFLMKSEPACIENGFENWITVFGYTPNDVRCVLTYFTTIGCIKEQKISNTGNWMHLHYESKMHAVAALNRNGRIINSNLMIGVKPCDDKTVDTYMEAPVVNKVPTDILNNSRYIDPEPERLTIDANHERNNFSMLNCSMRSLRQEIPNPVEPEIKPQSGLLRRTFSMVFGRK